MPTMPLPPGSYNHFPQVIELVKTIAPQIVKKVARDVQATAAANAKRKTGFMASSIYVVTLDTSSYGQRVVDGAPGSYLLPEVGKPTSDTTAYIAVGANYGIYVEFGTSRMAAQPYLVPAADAVAPSFQQAWDKLEDYIREQTLGGII